MVFFLCCDLFFPLWNITLRKLSIEHQNVWRTNWNFASRDSRKYVYFPDVVKTRDITLRKIHYLVYLFRRWHLDCSAPWSETSQIIDSQEDSSMGLLCLSQTGSHGASNDALLTTLLTFTSSCWRSDCFSWNITIGRKLLNISWQHHRQPWGNRIAILKYNIQGNLSSTTLEEWNNHNKIQHTPQSFIALGNLCKQSFLLNRVNIKF